MPDKYLSRISGAAESYLYNNWSVIPVYGDTRPGNEKQASVNWKPYQRRKPNNALLTTWFSDRKRTGGLAVITGRVSCLAVLDFDDEAVWELFRSQHPDLCETRTTRTPNGWHLHFEIAPTITIKTSKRADGIDLLFEGCYALLPPTTIRGKSYTLEQGGHTKTLTQSQADCIMAFVDSQTDTSELSAEQRPMWGDDVLDTTLAKQHEKGRLHEAPPLTEATLRGLYHWMALPGKRNNALFECAIEARDSSWPVEATLRVLVPLHAENKHPMRSESDKARSREAVATIQSAYSRPPRKYWRPRTRDLPNNIKERLLMYKFTHVLRVITGLRKMGLFDGEHVTLGMAMEILRDTESGELIVGEYSIKEAFGAVVPDGVRIFEMVRSQTTPDASLYPPQTADAVATPDGAVHISKCLEMSLKKPHFSPTGKPYHWFKLPSDIELADKLRLAYSRIADELTLDDIRDAKTTRMMVHYRFIQRKPGFYHSEWLADRLGVSVRTKNTYDNALPDLHKEPSYYATVIHPGNLSQIPEETFGGLFLQDNFGYKYPAERGIAKSLLKKGRRLLLMQQSKNYYKVGDIRALAFVRRPNGTETGYLDASTPRNMLSSCLEGDFSDFTSFSCMNRPNDEESGIEAPYLSDSRDDDSDSTSAQHTDDTSDELANTKKVTKRIPDKKKYHRKFRDPHLESIANRVKERINKLTPDHQLSISSSRRLIHQFGYKSVWRAMHEVEYKYGQGRVTSPPGLLTIIARCHYKSDRASAHV